MPDTDQHMTCMEVWGGNQAAEHSVVLPGLDAWVYSKPFGQGQGGGDVYYMSACATGRITRILLADVSGHGEVVAQLASGLRRLMQQYVNYIDQTAFVRSMNTRFTELSGVGTFATAIVSTFFGPTNDLTLCIAGHPAPILYRAKARRWTVLDDEGQRNATNIPLGIDDVEDWAQFGVTLDVGDLVLCYTDSLIESYGADGEMLGTVGLRQVVEKVDASDPQQFISKLLAAIAALADGNLTADDVTVLLLRPNGQAPYTRLRDKLLAPMRIIRGAVSSVFSGDQPIPWPELSLANLGGAIFKRFNRAATNRPRSGESTSRP